MKKVIGVVLAVIGGVGEMYAISTISNDFFYTYRPPFTEHETEMISIAVISGVALLVGLLMLFVKSHKHSSGN